MWTSDRPYDFKSPRPNPAGSVTRSSATTAVVHGGIAQLGNVNSGATAYFSQSATEIGSTFAATSGGSVTDFNFFVRGAGGTQTFTPKIYAVSGTTKGALLATGAAVSVSKGADGMWYSTAISGLTITGGRLYYLALLPSGTGNSYVGEDTTSAPSRSTSTTRRDVIGADGVRAARQQVVGDAHGI